MMASGTGDGAPLEILRSHRVPGVVAAQVTSDGTVEVTFSSAAPDHVMARVRELLAPRRAVSLWYDGEAAHLPEDRPPGSDDTACAVCGATPAPWPHTTRTPAGAVIASATWWHLCDECHELVGSGQIHQLAARITLPDLDADQKLELAARIR